MDEDAWVTLLAVVVTIVGAILFFVLATFVINFPSRFSSGALRGYVTQIHKEGVFSKTNEIHFVVSGMRNTNISSGNMMGLSAVDLTANQKDMDAIEDAIQSEKEIMITFSNKLFCPFSSETHSCSFIDSIKEI